MTTQEFSDQFDILWNNISSNQAPGLNEYEKSVFLTKAQSQLVIEYFNSRIDAVGGGFDGSQKRQYDFSGLIRTESLYDVNTYANRISTPEKLDKRSKVFLFPQNYFLAVNEIISDSRWQYSVMALDYSEYQRLMLKPYNLPVKRAAWRLLTDKKNCNYWREYTDSADPIEEGDNSYRKTETDYMFMSSWADEKRNLKITIKKAGSSAALHGVVNNSTLFVNDSTWGASGLKKIVYLSKVRGADESAAEDAVGNTGLFSRNMAISKRGWLDSYTYEVEIIVDDEIKDDHDAIESIKDGFSALKTYCRDNGIPYTTYDEGDYEDFIKACRHTDGFAMASAPSKYKKFASSNGYTFTTEVIQVPFAEIIGKFVGGISYQLRYVRTLKPIILDDLYNYGDDLTINGVRQKTECILPEECHQEILERAVTLAKIAWQGGTATQAAAQQRN